MKSSERNLEEKQCVDVASEDDKLPPVRASSQQNRSFQVTIASQCHTCVI